MYEWGIIRISGDEVRVNGHESRLVHMSVRISGPKSKLESALVSMGGY